MRIKGVQLAGLALALVGVSSKGALANDVTITTATTAPITTASPDGVSAGNVTVNAGGSITVTAGQTAITENANKNVANSGTLASSDAINTTGIGIVGGFAGTIDNFAAINLLETYVQADSDSDGDLDGAYALGAGRNGIQLLSGTFTGNITNAGVITIEGNNSSGIRLDGRVVGNVRSSNTLGVVGDNSFGFAMNGGAGAGVSGDVTLAGTIATRGQNTIGALINAPIGGRLNISASLTNTGYHGTVRPVNATAAAKLDADDFLLSGSAIDVRSSVGGGITIVGTGVENDTDDDGDGITEAAGDTDDNTAAAIVNFSSAPTILIRPDATTPANIVLGPTAGGFGLLNRGAIAAGGIFDGISSTAVRIEGLGGATVTTSSGFRNDGALSSTAFEANAFGLIVGAGATVPTVSNRKTIAVATTSESAQNATGLLFLSGASVPALVNTGTLTSQVFGEAGSAFGIVDQSNSLASISNSGSIVAQVILTDADASDNIVPIVTGSGVAIDVSASSIGVTLNQVADTVFTDDDAVDDDLSVRPLVQIVGAVRFGSGADTVNLLSGQILGDMSFGAGADSLTINNGARYAGRLTDSDGALTINVINGALGLAGGAVNITSAHFGALSELGVLLATVPANSTKITSTGAIVFDAGAVVTPVIPVGLPASGNHVFLTALGGLTGASNVTRTITGSGAPFIYNLAITGVTGDPNSLQAIFALKTTTELGLDANQTAAFNPIIAALRQDDAASTAFSGLDTDASFRNAFDDLLPNYASAAAELAATAIQQSQSATSNRMAATRVRDVHDVSVWAQEIGYQLKRTPESFGVEYDGFGFGLAGGIDGPLDNGALFGLSASFIASEVTQPGRADGEISTSLGEVNAYLASSMGPIDLDFIAGIGAGRLKSRRFVEIGAFNAQADAAWWAYEGHGSMRASLPVHVSRSFTVSPQLAFTYVALNEQGYEETGGGAAIDLDVDSTLSQRLWGDVGIEFAGRLGRAGSTVVTPRLSLGYRANLIDEAADRTLRFASGGADFTLTDETQGTGGPLVGIGFDATNGFSSFSITYEGEFGDQLQRNSLNASVRFRF